jgi:hypothetical protein
LPVADAVREAKDEPPVDPCESAFLLEARAPSPEEAGLPTMSRRGSDPEEAAECIRAFRPKIVYPYDYRGSNLELLRGALAGEPGVEVRVRPWYPAGGGG